MDTRAQWGKDTQLDIPLLETELSTRFPGQITTQQESCDWLCPSPTRTYYHCSSVLSRKVMWPSSASRVGGGEADWTCSLLGGQPQLYGRKRCYRKADSGSAWRSAEGLEMSDLSLRINAAESMTHSVQYYSYVIYAASNSQKLQVKKGVTIQPWLKTEGVCLFCYLYSKF